MGKELLQVESIDLNYDILYSITWKTNYILNFQSPYSVRISRYLFNHLILHIFSFHPQNNSVWKRLLPVPELVGFNCPLVIAWDLLEREPVKE